LVALRHRLLSSRNEAASLGHPPSSVFSRVQQCVQHTQRPRSDRAGVVGVEGWCQLPASMPSSSSSSMGRSYSGQCVTVVSPTIETWGEACRNGVAFVDSSGSLVLLSLLVCCCEWFGLAISTRRGPLATTCCTPRQMQQLKPPQHVSTGSYQRVHVQRELPNSSTGRTRSVGLACPTVAFNR
jgi:hypothetical protein